MNKKNDFNAILNKKNNDIIDIQEIKEFENNYNIIIPDYYKKFLIEFGGSDINDNLVFKTNIDVFGDISYMSFFSLYQIEGFINNVLDNEYDDIGHELLNKKIIYISYAVSNGLSIGLSTIDNKIGIIDYGLTLDTSFYIIAESFEEFINGFEKQE